MNFYSISNSCSLYRRRDVQTYSRRVYVGFTYIYPDDFDKVQMLGFDESYEYGYILCVL